MKYNKNNWLLMVVVFLIDYFLVLYDNNHHHFLTRAVSWLSIGFGLSMASFTLFMATAVLMVITHVQLLGAECVSFFSMVVVMSFVSRFFYISTFAWLMIVTFSLCLHDLFMAYYGGFVVTPVLTMHSIIFNLGTITVIQVLYVSAAEQSRKLYGL